MADEVMKIVVVGSSGTGKTAIIQQYVSHEFSEDTQATIGVEFQTKHVNVDGRKLSCQIWDTAGQERYRAISRSIYHGAKGVIAVYDITSQNTFDELPTWLHEVRSLIPPTAPIILCGNKVDLDHARVVRKESADAFARQQNLVLFETSAKDRTNIDKVFEFLVKQIHEAMMAAAASGQSLGRPTPQRAIPGRAAPPGASVDLSRPNGSPQNNGQNGDGQQQQGEEEGKCPC